VTGRVVDEDGSPLAGAEISVKTADAKQEVVAKVSSGEDGRFEVAGLQEGAYALNVLMRSGQESKLYTWQEAPQFFPFLRVREPGEHVDLGDLGLVRRGTEVAGTVTDQDGVPIAGARVFVSRNDGYHWGPAITDDRGGYKLLVSSWDRSWGVTALKVLVSDDFLFAQEHDDWKPWETNRVDAKIDTNPVTVHGTVQLDGTPPAEAEVYVYQTGQKSELTFHPYARVDPGGEYRTAALPRGVYEIVCRVQGSPTITLEKDLRRSGSEEQVDFTAKRSSGEIAGRIRMKVAGRMVSG
jgi:hypothetical protein